MDYDKGIVKKVKNYKKIQVVYKEIQIEETANNFFIWYSNWERKLVLKSSMSCIKILQLQRRNSDEKGKSLSKEDNYIYISDIF